MKFKNSICFFIFVFAFFFLKDDMFLNAAPVKEYQKLESTNSTEKMKDLEEIVIGDKKAPITVIVYLSFTCGICKKFIDNVLPDLSKIAGIKIYLRNITDNQTSKHAAMFIRFLGGDDIEKVKELYLLTFKYQDELLKIKTDQDVLSFLNKILPDAKMTANKIAECKNNKEIHLGLEAVQFEATNTFKISSSPSIIIIKNGKSEIHQGFMSCDDIVKKIK